MELMIIAGILATAAGLISKSLKPAPVPVKVKTKR